MKNIIIILLTLLFSLLSITQSIGQLPPVPIDHNGEVIALDRKAWASNVSDVSESYQFNFEIPAIPPYTCVKIDRVEFAVSAQVAFDNSGGCFSGFWTHVLDCESHDPISCDPDPFDCCSVDAQGINNWIVNNDDDDLFNGQILGFDVVAVSSDPPCIKDLISQGLFAADVFVSMEVYYKPDLSDEELELEDDPTICPGQTYDLEGPSGFELYEWIGPIDSDDRTLLDAIPGEYTLVVTDSKGCTLADDIEIIADGGFAVTFNETSPFLVCGENNNETLQALVNNVIETSDYDYEWTTASGATMSGDNIEITNSGTYTVVVTDEDTDCMITESIEVIVAQLSIAQIDSISMNVISSCETIYTAEAFVSAIDNNTYTYEWLNGVDTIRTPTLDITQSGTYILNLINDLGCPTTSDTIIVNLTPPSIAGQDNLDIQCNNQTIDLTAYLSSDASLGGSWENVTGTGNLSGSQFDPMQEEGIFTFNYIVINPAPCDNDTSVVTITINPTYNISIDDQLCDGDMIIVNGVTYDNTNQTGVEQMLSVNGCDSIININLTFVDAITESITDELCADGSVDVNGITYDINRPNGEETLTSTSGCDSIITIDLTFVTQKDSLIMQELCSDGSIEVNGTTYDINNQSGIDTTASVAGCDSIITIDLTFVDELTTTIMQDLCPDLSIEVNGVTYDINNATGIETLTSISGCDSIVNVELIFFPENPVLEDMVVFCDSVFIIDEWVFQAGTIIDTLIDVNGCDSIISTIVELDNCLRSIFIGSTDLTCFESGDGTISIEVVGDYNYPLEYNVILNSGTNNQGQIDQEGNVLIESLPADSYNVEITDNIGTLIFDQRVIIASPSELMVSLTEEVRLDCNADTNAQISSQINASVMGPFTYMWSDQSDQSTLSNVGAGIYSLTIEDSNNCTATNSITITEPDPITADIRVINITCNSNDGGGIVISNIDGGVEPYITSIDGVTFDDIREYNNLPADTYELIIQDINGCTYEEIVAVIEESSFTISPIDTIRIEEGQSVEIDLNLDFTAQSISWSPSTDLSCDDCESPTASPQSDASYIVSVIDELGCTIVTEVHIRVTRPEVIVDPIDVYIPNTFSPRLNDGVNDVFKPLTSNDAEIIVESFIIYDRWGGIVHQESGSIEGWDGFINDSESVSGVYVYKINYTINDKEEIRVGSVTIVN